MATSRKDAPRPPFRRRARDATHTVLVNGVPTQARCKPRGADHVPTTGAGGAIHARATHALVRYQATCSPVEIAYGTDAYELGRLHRHIQETSHAGLHHSPEDPPRYEVVLRFRSRGGKAG